MAQTFFPSIAGYNKAVLAIDSRGQTPTLRSLKPRVQGMGLPRVISGGFALTYELTGPDSRRYALRCFQEEQADRPRRYEAMARFLGSLDPDDGERFVSFEYLPEGIKAGGSLVPVVLMEWAPGAELGLYLEEHHRNGARLEALRDGLSDLAAFLESREFAHGDLQVGNLFVRDSGALVMIDYDGVWLPELDSLAPHEHGHINFQHPLREERRADSTVDRFSLIAIDTALGALIAEPKLWDTYASGENVLFGQGDLVDPAASPLFSDLASLAKVAVAADLFAATCAGAYEDVPTLKAFREACAAARPGYQPKPTAADAPPGLSTLADPPPPTAAKVVPRPEPRVYRGQYPVLEATRVSSIAKHEGKKVEVVGRIYDIKEGETKYGDPYIFVNFSDWRGRAFKINVWSDGLDEFEEWPDSGWVGKWVSVTGLVDEPYTNERLGYTHHSITANNPTQIRMIPAKEASFRLGKEKPIGGSRGSRGTAGPSWSSRTDSPGPRSSRSTRNADLVAKLGPSQLRRGAEKRPPSRTGAASSAGPSPGAARPSRPGVQRTAPPTTTPHKRGCSSVIWGALVIIAVAVAVAASGYL